MMATFWIELIFATSFRGRISHLPQRIMRLVLSVRRVGVACPYQIRPGSRVVTSWTSHALPSGSLKEKNDP
jgi:hypothetical protein